MPDINLSFFQAINGIAGHWWWADSVVGLALANELIKSALIGGCFFAAWYRRTTFDVALAARRNLLVTLVASMLTLATTTAISHVVVQPRPYLQAHKIYQLRGNALQEMPRLDFRRPLDNRSQERERAWASGNIPENDLGSFPSDHAGFFVCLSFGICIAAPRIGVLALAWTVFVILGGKVMTGMHMPSEIGASCLVAALWLGACTYFSRAWLRRLSNRIVTWTTEHPSLTAAALFIALFEIASTFDHVKALLAAVGKHV